MTVTLPLWTQNIDNLIEQLELSKLVLDVNNPTSITSVLAVIQSRLDVYGFLDGLTITSDGNGTTVDTNELLDAIGLLLDDTRDQVLTGVLAFTNSLSNQLSDISDTQLVEIQNQITQLGTDILGLFFDQQTYIGNRLDEISTKIGQENFKTRSDVAGMIVTLQGGLLDAINSNQNSISSLIQQDLTQTVNTINNLDNKVSNAINNQTQTLTAQIQSITSTGGTGDTTVNYQSAWTTALIVDLLNVLETFRTDFNNKDFSPQITNEVNVAGDGTDTSAGLPFDITGNFLADQITQLITSTDFTSLIAGSNVGLDQSNSGVLDILLYPDKYNINTIDDLWGALNQSGFAGSLLTLLWNVSGGLMMFLTAAHSIAKPFTNNFETLARTQALDGLLPLNTLLELQLRNLIPPDEFLTGMTRLGYRNDQTAKFLQAVTSQLPEPYVREAYLRGKIEQPEWKLLMQRLGYRGEDLSLLETLIENIPPIQDAILFAVREAYDDNLADDLQLDANYETIKDKFEANLRANGIDSEYAKYYWRAHWRLPSPTQFYEMLHRGLITYDELLAALRVSDYSPQWQSKLAEISYAEYTRVDIRRMHKLGILSDAEVTDAYMRIGYNQERAENMTRFTLELNGTSENESVKQFTLSQALNLYVTGLYDENQTRQALSSIGYNQSEITLLIELAEISKNAETLGDISKDNKRRIISSLSKSYIEGILPEQFVRDKLSRIGYPDDKINTEIEYLNIEREILQKENQVDIIFNQYSRYQMDINNASSKLAGLGYSGTELANIMKLWAIIRDDRKKLPTKSEAGKFLNDGFITRSEYEDILRGQGIMEQYIQFY